MPDVLGPSAVSTTSPTADRDAPSATTPETASVPRATGTPAAPAGGAARTARRRLPLGRDPLLVVYAALLAAFWIPGRLIFDPLGALGHPAALLALGAALVYGLGRLAGGHLAVGRQPMRTMFVVFGLVALVSYLAGHVRPLAATEAAGSDRALFNVLAMLGLGLLTADALRDKDHLERLLRLVVVGAAVFAAMGVLQWVTGLSPNTYIQIPGLTLRDVDINLARADFTRVQSTALHPIEFGVVLALTLPIALHFAMVGRDGRRPSRWNWVPVLAIMFAIPLAVSRASVLGVVVAAVVAGVGWSWRVRLNALFAAGLILLAMRAAFPGVLGTLVSTFLFFDEDPSIEGRTQDYPKVLEYVSERPWFGRGLGTFTPEHYFFLDNEYLNQVLTGGVVAVLTFVALFLVAMGLGRGVYHHSRDPWARSLGQSLTAATAVTAVTWFTYDGMAFRLNAGLAFVLMGATAALWRLEVGRLRWGVGANRERPVQFEEDPEVKAWSLDLDATPGELVGAGAGTSAVDHGATARRA